MANIIDINYFGEWSQNVVIGLLTGLISGIFVALIFELPKNPTQVSQYLIAFAILIAVFLTGNVIIQIYREKINKKSNKSLKRQTSSKPFKIPYNLNLFFILVILVIVGLGTIFAPFIFISPLTGAIVGALIALLSSHYMFQVKQKSDLKTISRGFYVELDCYQDWMQPLVDTIEKIGETNLLGQKEIIILRFQDLYRPFFDNDSLYYSFRKEMFQFDKDTSEKLFRLYSLIKGAEESRRSLLSNNQDKEHFDMAFQVEKIEHIKQNFQQSLTLIAEIKQDFDQM
jgi:uncharacterized membrane protein YgaE (UPF0421/DUF939 family)